MPKDNKSRVYLEVSLLYDWANEKWPGLHHLVLPYGMKYTSSERAKIETYCMLEISSIRIFNPILSKYVQYLHVCRHIMHPGSSGVMKKTNTFFSFSFTEKNAWNTLHSFPLPLQLRGLLAASSSEDLWYFRVRIMSWGISCIWCLLNSASAL